MWSSDKEVISLVLLLLLFLQDIICFCFISELAKEEKEKLFFGIHSWHTPSGDFFSIIKERADPKNSAQTKKRLSTEEKKKTISRPVAHSN